MIQLDTLKSRLNKTLDVEPMGPTRIYNYLLEILESHDEVKDFMINQLGYKNWFVNKIKWHQEYCKKRYQQELQFKSANNI